MDINDITGKRLLVDLCVLRQSYEIHELFQIIWMACAKDVANALAKMNAPGGLELLLENNKLYIDQNIGLSAF